jgi:hypothetical protein
MWHLTIPLAVIVLKREAASERCILFIVPHFVALQFCAKNLYPIDGMVQEYNPSKY